MIPPLPAAIIRANLPITAEAAPSAAMAHQWGGYAQQQENVA
jgi:hypothetical protein